jgi:hypothetical protein
MDGLSLSVLGLDGRCCRYRYRASGVSWIIDLSLSVLRPDERFVDTDTGHCEFCFVWDGRSLAISAALILVE